MRIHDVVYAPPPQAAEYARRPRTNGPPPETAPALEDIVQLSLSREGIWEVQATPPALESTLQDSAYAFAAVLPRVARLSHALWRVYSPTGLTSAMEYARGLLVDVYA